MTEQDILALFHRENAIWFYNHQNGPTQPHAALSSQSCSDGYINCPVVLSNPNYTRLLAEELVSLLQKREVEKPDWVVGSAYSAITISYELARLMDARHGFTRKDPDNPRRMFWKDLTIPKGSRVLICEDLITTFGTVDKVRDAIVDGNRHEVYFIPETVAVAYRPKKFPSPSVVDHTIALIRREVQTWLPGKCPLCANGSPRLRPRDHWSQFSAGDRVP